MHLEYAVPPPPPAQQKYEFYRMLPTIGFSINYFYKKNAKKLFKQSGEFANQLRIFPEQVLKKYWGQI